MTIAYDQLRHAYIDQTTGMVVKALPVRDPALKLDPVLKDQPRHVEPVTGRKDDGGKLDPTLLFDDLPNALYAVTEVLQWAITKKQPVPYERGSWQGVDNFHRRYRAALLRHMLNAAKSAKEYEHLSDSDKQRFEHQTDAETGLLELAHIATDALFMLEMAVRNAK